MLLANICRLCKEQKISIARLERECGLGNGTIRGWKKSKPSVENLDKVAKKLNTTMEYLMGAEPEQEVK